MTAPKSPQILIIGAGMSGILVAMRLLKAGFTDFRIYEKDSDLGGTWRINTYPGIACDVPSHYYTYQNEPNDAWSARLPQGAEIRQYLQSVADKYDIRKYISFNKEVVRCKHDGETWTIKMADGETLVHDYVIACCGLLYHPTYPDIDGLDSFTGEAFHSARWNHDVDLTDKKVGLIGNGSTAAQIISSLAKDNIDVTMFLRTPQWVFPLPDRKYTAIERKLTRWFPALARFGHAFYRVAFENLFAKAVIQSGWQRNLMGWACRRNLKTVKDPALRERLTPDFEPLCKRLVMSTTYYDAVQQHNVTIADGNIEKIDANKVFTKDGNTHELDVLVMATGYDAHAYFRPMNMTNAQGVSLDDIWKDGPYALRTVAVPGFPNFFFTLGPQSPIGNFSAISIVETQIDYIVDCIKMATHGNFKTIDPKTSATNAFNEMVYAAMPDTIWVSGCTNWYIGEKGIPSAWPFTGARFRKELKKPDFSEYMTGG
ncbi:MAG: NAD(P)/FAD-dependent oxidoreductase [Pseudomonadota bacterium]|nr:NAD(P)/FAD-dependent oxidoreductase [Pseudomonadota bacterium]